LSSRVAVLHQCVRAAESPPAQAEIGDALAELRGARLADEEVHVVHLDRVDAVGRHQVPHDALHARRRLREPSPVGHRDDRAETAGERAAERGVVRHRAIAEIVLVDVAGHVDAVVRQIRQVIQVRQRLDRVVDDLNVSLGCLSRAQSRGSLRAPGVAAAFPRQAADAVQHAARAQDVDQLDERALPLRADHDVDIWRAQHRSACWVGK